MLNTHRAMQNTRNLIDAIEKCRIHTGQTTVCDHQVVHIGNVWNTAPTRPDTQNTQKHAYSSMISNAGEVAWPKLNQVKATSLPGTHCARCPLHLYDSVRFGLLWTTASILLITSGVSRGMTSRAFMFSTICSCSCPYPRG